MGTGIRDQGSGIRDLTTTTVVDLPAPAAGAASAGSWWWSSMEALEAWNAAVPQRMQAAGEPREVPQRADWPRVFAAVAASSFLCGDKRRNGPVTLPWVLAHAEDVLAHAPALPAPKLAVVPVAEALDEPRSERHCARCRGLFPVVMNAYLVDDTMPNDTPVWILPEHGCGPTGDVTTVTQDEADAHEARRLAAAGVTTWRPGYRPEQGR